MRFVIVAIAVSVLIAACTNPVAPDDLAPPINSESGNNLTDQPPTWTPVPMPTVLKAATTSVTQSGSTAATLTVSKTSVLETMTTDGSGKRQYRYYPSFVIAETSGRSGATFSRIQ